MFVIITFIASNAQVVTLPKKTASFYLERHYTAKKLAEQLVIKNNIISNLELQLVQKDAIISTSVSDKNLYEELLKVKEDEAAVIQKDLKSAYKEVTKQKIQKKFIIIGSIILIALAAR